LQTAPLGVEVRLYLVCEDGVRGNYVEQFCVGEVELHTVGDGDEVIGGLGVAAVVIVLLADVEGRIVVVGGEDI
jgi:hypothetical protein